MQWPAVWRTQHMDSKTPVLDVGSIARRVVRFVPGHG